MEVLWNLMDLNISPVEEHRMQTEPEEGLKGQESEEPTASTLEEPLNMEDLIGLRQFGVEQSWQETLFEKMALWGHF